MKALTERIVLLYNVVDVWQQRVQRFVDKQKIRLEKCEELRFCDQQQQSSKHDSIYLTAICVHVAMRDITNVRLMPRDQSNFAKF